MAKIIDARNYVGVGLPATNGQRLADELLRHDPATWGDLIIDARGCPPEYLNASLFYAFWQRLFEIQPSRLMEGKAIRWEFAYPFQETVLSGISLVLKRYASPLQTRNIAIISRVRRYSGVPQSLERQRPDTPERPERSGLAGRCRRFSMEQKHLRLATQGMRGTALQN